MINSEPTEAGDAAVERAMQSGAHGAILVAGLAVAIVIGLWFAFYFLVFAPRGTL
jgi:hypothetical protein